MFRRERSAFLDSLVSGNTNRLKIHINPFALVSTSVKYSIELDAVQRLEDMGGQSKNLQHSQVTRDRFEVPAFKDKIPSVSNQRMPRYVKFEFIHNSLLIQLYQDCHQA